MSMLSTRTREGHTRFIFDTWAPLMPDQNYIRELELIGLAKIVLERIKSLLEWHARGRGY